MKYATFPMIFTLALGAVSAHAIQPVTWTHTTEADFEPGEAERTVVTNLGDIKLATDVQTLGDMPDGVTVIYDLAQVGDDLYLAAGPQGKLLKKEDEGFAEVAATENEQVFALIPFNGELFVGVSGEGSSRIAVLRDGNLETHAELAEVRYVWDIVALPSDGSLGDARFAVATGTDGKVLLIAGGKVSAEALDAEQANVLCLAVGPDALYAGTDTEGLVYRITPKDEGYETFVVYDADEPEVATLHVTADGVVYAGTADAEQAYPGRLGEAASEETGRPDSAPPEAEDAPEAPDHPEAPQDPDAPDLPNIAPDPDPMAEAEAPEAPETPETPEAPEAVEAPEAEAVEAEAPAEAPAPTPEQYDELRKVMRKQLEEARKSGKLQVDGLQGPTGGGRVASSGSSSQRARPTRPQPQRKDGNAVYRIDTDGFVREVFRESVMILKLAAVGEGQLLVLTGNEGQVYRIDPAKDETVVLTDLDAEQAVTAMVTDDGDILLATANPATLVQLGDRFAATGTYTSDVLDAQQVSLFGTLTVALDLPADTSVTVETRSGNTADPHAAAWSPWSSAQVFMPNDNLPALQPREIKVTSPPARFLQYRLTLAGNPDATPAVERVEATYVTPNLRAGITSFTAAYGEIDLDDPEAEPATQMNLEWEAADPNGDPLIFAVAYRPADSEKFITLAKDLSDTSFTWDTHHVPDGRYILRVTVTDKLANPGSMALDAARLSDPVLVDNTPPQLESAITDAQAVAIGGLISDQYSKIARLGYSVDGDEQYTPILPEDLIFDSTSESFSVTIPDLAPGPHVVSLRAIDARGNTTHKAVLIGSVD